MKATAVPLAILLLAGAFTFRAVAEEIAAIPVEEIIEEEAEGTGSFNPADPTSAASHIEINPEYGDFPGGRYWATRFVYDVDWAEGVYSVTLELPVGQAEYGAREWEGGIGDFRTRFFWKFHDAPSADDFMQNAVFNLDVFAPTGDADRGLGVGTWVLTPSVILATPLTDNLTTYPWLKFKISTGKTTAGPSTFGTGVHPFSGSAMEDRLVSTELEVPFVYQFPDGRSWATVTPSIDYDFKPEPGKKRYEFSLRGEIGRMFGRIGLGADATVHIAGDESQTFLGRMFTYFYF